MRLLSSLPCRLAASAMTLAALAAPPLSAQTIDDAEMIRPRQIRVGLNHAVEQWRAYWEGARERTNDNIGTLTTQQTILTLDAGLTRRVSAFTTLPYVQTRANAGVLASQAGVQDLTAGVKVRLFTVNPTSRLRLRATGLVGGGVPLTSYTPDFLPMSIGLGARHIRTRGVLHLQDKSNVFADVAAGYQWRDQVMLDRPAYYTDGRLVLSNRVAMPDVRDVTMTVGYQDSRWCIPLALVQQRTLGGGDIRRQDMPFVSNRMDFTKAQLHVMYTMRSLPLVLNAGGLTTLRGRNVGKSTMAMAGVTYVLGR